MAPVSGMVPVAEQLHEPSVVELERRNWFVDAEIRGVSHHCRIVTYQNTAKTALKVTRSSLL